jgi:uncharacterized protein HemX
LGEPKNKKEGTMAAPKQADTSAGFTVIEGVLILGVVAIIGVVGYVFYQNVTRPQANSNTATTTSSQASAPAGTSANVEQLTQQAAADEMNADSGADSEAQQTATSTDSTISNVGGAYNESSF